MLASQLGICTLDEVNLHLVAGKLKPAAIITANVSSVRCDRVGYENELTGYFDGHDICYRHGPILRAINNTYMRGDGSEFFKEGYEVDVGMDGMSLGRLLAATTAEQKGLALGYPSEAVIEFGGDVDVHNSVRMALEHDIKIPTWLAYISFVPERLDLVSGDKR